MSFAELLKSQREAAGLTQMELSETAGITQGSVAHYERGTREPTWAAVQKLADALGVSVEVFRETADAPAGSGSVSHPEPGGYGVPVPPSPESPKKGKAKGTDKKKSKK
jgi:transcriptional regulator with XRE-family HTH domain